MKFALIQSRLESILEREFSLGKSRLRLVGDSSLTSLAMMLAGAHSKHLSDLPHLIVVPSEEDAAKFVSIFAFFDSERHVSVLTGFDVSPYSGLYPRTQATAQRLRFLREAADSDSNQVFVAPIQALLQNCLPYKIFNKACSVLKVDFDFPEDLHSFLNQLGYQASPVVEGVGQYSQRGGILDLFSPGSDFPIRLELFGETVASMRSFDPENQMSKEQVTSYPLLPCRETLWSDENFEGVVQKFKASCEGREVARADLDETLRSLARKTPVEGLDFLLPYFYPKLESPLSYFSSALNVWLFDAMDVRKNAEQSLADLSSEYKTSDKILIRPPLEALFSSFENLPWIEGSRSVEISSLETQDFSDGEQAPVIEYRSYSVMDFTHILKSQAPGSENWLTQCRNRVQAWGKEGYRLIVSVRNRTVAQRLAALFDRSELPFRLYEDTDLSWQDWPAGEPAKNNHPISLVLRPLPESVRLSEEKIIFLRDEDFLGKKLRGASEKKWSEAADEFQKQARRLSFGDLKPGDCVVHVKHGVGVYEGLRVMNISGVDSEFIQLHYKDNDKLYLPVYRVNQLQKYSGAAAATALDKLGGTGWEKTKTKVKAGLRDIASELLVLYARRNQLSRPAFALDAKAYQAFEEAFPYDETEDQWRAIQEVLGDLKGTRPMDRLICGDVGYGKTEVAMRAAFVAATSGKQTAILAPTTVLSFQHYETFKKRFAGSPYVIRELNRFVEPADAKKTLQELKEGKVHVIIGTHRVLSKDVVFQNLGLLVIDEEQKFGVAHKERIRKLKTEVDTLAMSATPIPRTLNMSLAGIRDLSLINTAPVDRLPTRTFISKWDPETIRKAITSEIKRGGQVYFIHNRVQSIYSLADELRTIVPDARIKVGHGQMDEVELEKTMVQFFNHEIDVLLCTTIVESGMDVPRANTMFIDQAQMMGLSQLYQLRGRVGRSKQRAYCYLILPRGKQLDKQAEERLKVIQENTALGSGIRIAQYDLDLRGAGNILGEEQSGHINAVGYELYMDLLQNAIHELRGEPTQEDAIDPEVNLRIPALIPDSYIADIRMRLSYYKALSEVRDTEELEKLESELRDQFGEPPEPVQNLMGLMLIRSLCKVLSIKDLSAGTKNVSLLFSPKTGLKSETVISLAMRQNKKYSIAPDNRLNVRMNNITWPAVHEELSYLITLL
jgi:transcription-repair coupling factor (superfamily II helicase)